MIEELSQKQIQEQQETERRILEKIKYKMDRIKASQKRIHGSGHKEPSSHQRGKMGAQNRFNGNYAKRIFPRKGGHLEMSLLKLGTPTPEL